MNQPTHSQKNQSPQDHQQLDHLLQQWSAAYAPQPEHLAELKQQISQQLNNSEQQSVAPSNVFPITPEQRQHRTFAAGLAVAASLLVAVGAWRYHTHQQYPHNNRPQQIAQAIIAQATIDASDNLSPDTLPPNTLWSKHLEHQQRLLNEYQHVFDQEIAWVAESEGQSDLRLLPSTATTTDSAAPHDYVVIQLTLVARTAGKTEWQPVRTYNLLAGQQQLVEVSLAENQGPKLILWAYPLDKNMISIDLSCQLPALANVQIESSNIQRTGQRTSIHSFKQKGVEYQLFQTVDLLRHDNLG